MFVLLGVLYFGLFVLRMIRIFVYCNSVDYSFVILFVLFMLCLRLGCLVLRLLFVVLSVCDV